MKPAFLNNVLMDSLHEVAARSSALRQKPDKNPTTAPIASAPLEAQQHLRSDHIFMRKAQTKCHPVAAGF
jgi:hypothetical protein